MERADIAGLLIGREAGSFLRQPQNRNPEGSALDLMAGLTLEMSVSGCLIGVSFHCGRPEAPMPQWRRLPAPMGLLHCPICLGLAVLSVVRAACHACMVWQLAESTRITPRLQPC
ncbi:hypothetical protein EVJ50_11245 [Synechococcus sp. RSCCF101]|nr:hypothetical protein EVJ50_11245 [Synechococcus sp. RSCCF101]